MLPGGKESCGKEEEEGTAANLAGKFSPWEDPSGGSAIVLPSIDPSIFVPQKVPSKKVVGIFSFSLRDSSFGHLPKVDYLFFFCQQKASINNLLPKNKDP